MERAYRLIHGVAYPQLVRGEHETRVIESTLDDPEAFYYDHAVRLSDADVARFNHLRGKPICVEHDREICVGEIVKAYPSAAGELLIDAKIFVDTELGQEVWSYVERGALRGLSVGYDAQIKANDFGLKQVEDKSFHEVSLCYKPFFEGSYVSIYASKQNKFNSQKYNTTPAPTLLLFKIMASELQQESKQDAPVETPKAVEPAKVAEPVSKTAEAERNVLLELQREREQMEKMRAELEEMKKAKEIADKMNKAYEQEKAELKAQEDAKVLEKFRTEQKPWIEAQWKAEKGAEAELPQGYLSALEGAAVDPEQQTNFQAVCASAMAFKKQYERAQELERQLEEARREAQVYKEGDARGAAHINASSAARRAALNGTQNYKKRDAPDSAMESVDISASKRQQVRLFKNPTPNRAEAQLAQMEYPEREYTREFMEQPNLSINASAGIRSEEQTQYRPLFKRQVNSRYEASGPSMSSLHPHISQWQYQLRASNQVPKMDLSPPVQMGRVPVGNFQEYTERLN